MAIIQVCKRARYEENLKKQHRANASGERRKGRLRKEAGEEEGREGKGRMEAVKGREE